MATEIEIVQRQDFDKFWMVWSPQGREPTYRHLTLAAAKTEAARLARLNPNSQFCVLECVGAVMQKPPPTFWFDAVLAPPPEADDPGPASAAPDSPV